MATTQQAQQAIVDKIALDAPSSTAQDLAYQAKAVQAMATDTQYILDAVQQVTDEGTLQVAAVGNEGTVQIGAVDAAAAARIVEISTAMGVAAELKKHGSINTGQAFETTIIGLSGTADLTVTAGTATVSKVTSVANGDKIIITPTALGLLEITATIQGSGDTVVFSTYVIPVGQQLITALGTTNFTVPTGVTSVCIVAIGGGGGGNRYWSGYAGNGGALAYANDIPVTPGETLSVTVGAGGASQYNVSSSLAGGGSYVTQGGQVLFTAQGGQNGTVRANFVDGIVTCNGGFGGIGGNNGSHQYGGGGGAGGYTGRGGDGDYSTGRGGEKGHGGGGGGASGYASSTYGFGGGGGVGAKGMGEAGEGGGAYNLLGNTWRYGKWYAGKGGSGGDAGMDNSNTSQTRRCAASNVTYTMYHGQGGRFGGGGAGGGTSVSNNGNFCKGAQGAVRIIWGSGRNYPNNATDV